VVNDEQARATAGRGSIDLDLSLWPILITTAPARAVTDGELDEFCERFETALRMRGGRYVSVLDLRVSAGLTPKQRQMLARRMNETHSGLAAGRLAGTAMIFTSALMRSLLTAMFWLRKSNHPTAVFANPNEAVAWGRRQLTEGDKAAGE